jgi:hypothetical protein
MEAPVDTAPRLTRTEVFRKRMAEIRQQEADEKAQGPAEPETVRTQPAAAPEPKKKGCFGVLLIAAGFLLAGGAALIHWVC